MNILVTGGAGYVGSIVSEELIKRGYEIVVLDNLQQGHREAVLNDAAFVQADLSSPEELGNIFRRYQVGAVMHLAAETRVGYSAIDPRRFFQNNVVCGMNLLDVMLKYGVYNFIFSSSAAVYGEPLSMPVEEDQPEAPINSYGESKLMFEHVLQWYGKAYGIKHISLRYFNAAGASQYLGEDHCPETHLVPNILRAALDKDDPVDVFGTDYPTKDGSCIRDYVHVMDIARAHVLALGKLDDLSGRAYNLGSGSGYSVLEVVETAKKVSGVDIPFKSCPRRPGDPVALVASSGRAKSELGWKPEFPQIETIIESAWRWMKQHPRGYGAR